jgi:hypothetical protein
VPIRSTSSGSVVSVLSNHRGRLTVVCVATLVLVATCSPDHPLHPDYEELTQRGFYIYVLPESELEQRGWLQTVSIWSWDRHCKGFEVSETFNPISVAYRGQATQPELAITIGPWSMAWDHRKPTTEVKLDTLWALDSTAVYYTSDDYIRLKFQDQFGIPVQVSSSLPITELVQLINQLEYIGPPPETVTNPWDYSSCPGQ